MSNINERVIAYHRPYGFLGDKNVFLIRHGADGMDRSFFEGPKHESESDRESAIRVMRQQGGVDLSHNQITQLPYGDGEPGKPAIQWMAAKLTAPQAKQVRKSECSPGTNFDTSIWRVFSELYQITDTAKGRALSSFWNTTLFELIRGL